MFCKECGESNKEHFIYCSEDGTLLLEEKSNIILSKDNTKFCKNCGDSVKSYDLYCSNCGLALFEEQRKNSSAMSGTHDVKDFKKEENISSGLDIKSALIYAGLGAGIIFLISLILSFKLNNFVTDNLPYDLDIADKIKFFNPFDILLLLNFSSFKVNSSLNSNNFMTIVSSGIPTGLLLLPFIVFFIFGIHIAKTNNSLNKSISLKNIISIALSYGVLLSLISILNRTSIKLDMLFFVEKFILKKNFTFFSSLIHGTLISTISLLLGYSLYWKISKNDNLIADYDFLFNGLFVFMASGLLILAIIWISALFSLKLDLLFVLEMDMSEKLAVFMYLIQISSYLFLVVNFGMSVGQSSFFDEKLSLFTNMDYIEYNLGNKAVALTFLLVLIPIVLFFIYGRISKKTGKKNFIYTIIVYSLLVGGLAYISRIKIIASGETDILYDFFSDFDENIVIGFKIFYSIIGSFILATLSTLAGYFLSSEEGTVTPVE